MTFPTTSEMQPLVIKFLADKFSMADITFIIRYFLMYFKTVIYYVVGVQFTTMPQCTTTLHYIAVRPNWTHCPKDLKNPLKAAMK